MEAKTSIVLIFGAGQLGSRYLQGLVRCSKPLKIYVQDVSEESLRRAEQRWVEVHGTDSHHCASFIKSTDPLPPYLDLAIVATTAHVRPLAVGKIAGHSNVASWVLEKVLAQSESALDEIVGSVGTGSSAWVNTPRRMMPWYHEMKSQMALRHPLNLKVEGGAWGLACNAVHFLDLLAWWTGETLQEIDTEGLGSEWFEGKRSGNWEIFGSMEARFSGGSRVILSANEGDVFYSMSVSDGHRSWEIDEIQGLAQCSDGIKILGRIPYQSEMSSILVESILEHGRCYLPTLAESANLHRVFINGMLGHWRQAGRSNAAFLPIT
jgi:hypothetical protein